MRNLFKLVLLTALFVSFTAVFGYAALRWDG